MEFTTSLIKHSDISDEELTEICKLKAIRWNYSLDKHKKWVEENIMENDFHLLIMENRKPIAYTNLVDVSAIINHQNIKVRGIGNVCTSETGRGYGNILMQNVNEVLKQNNWVGILLCKEQLTAYYEKFNWKLLDKNTIINEKCNDINLMIYNLEDKVTALEYKDRNF